MQLLWTSLNSRGSTSSLMLVLSAFPIFLLLFSWFYCFPSLPHGHVHSAGAHDFKKHFLDQNLADYFQCTFPHVPSGNLGLVLFVSGNMRMQSKCACCQEWTPYFILRLGILCLYVVQNFSGVTDMGGGYSAWKESGLPLQTQRSQQARQA